MKNFIDFCFVRFYVSFSLYTSSLSNSYLTTWLTIPNFIIYLSKRHVFNFIQISSICSHFWKNYTRGHNFFRIFFIPNKMFKTSFLPKMNQNRVFVLVKFIFFNSSITKRYHFLKKLFFYFSLAFCSKFTASLLLIPLIIQG